MYHSRLKGNHYEVGYHYGQLLLKNNKKISNQPTFIITNQKRIFADKCLSLYQKYYPEICQEIKGLSDGQQIPYEDMYTFLFSMYCFELHNKCTCFAFSIENTIGLGRNSDFLVELEKLYMNCLYRCEGVYAFTGNTTAFIEMEDGVNEYGLAIGLTFVYPKIIKPGFNAGMLVRYLLEKCKNTKEAISVLKKLPIASSQTLTIVDHEGSMAIVECNCNQVIVIEKKGNENFVVTTNHFNSHEMKKDRKVEIDDWYSDLRYSTAYQSLKKYNHSLSIEIAENILKGKYGFMCQYDRKAGADTVWSVIYDVKNFQILRVEGNPSRKKYKEDQRFQFLK